MPSSRTTRLAALMLPLILVACSGGAASVAPSVAPTTPPPSGSPTASPSLSPTGIIDKVTAQLQDPAFGATFAIRGEMAVSSIPFEVTGTYAAQGEDWSNSVVVKGGGQNIASDEIKVDGVTYGRENGGVWVKRISGEGLDFGTFSLDLEDAGIVTKDGLKVHKLIVASGEPIDPSIFGVTAAKPDDLKGSLELYATDEGELAILTVILTGQMLTGGVQAPLDMTLDFVRDLDDPAIDIEAPADPWTLYHSEGLKFSVAYPSAWTEDGPLEDKAELFTTTGAELSVTPYPFEEASLNAYGDALVEGLGLGAPTGKVDVQLGGQPGIGFLWANATLDGETSNVVYVITKRGDQSYDFVWIFDPGDFGAQGDLVDDFLATVSWD